MNELKSRNVQLIFDESFIDFAEPAIRYTMIDEAIIENYPNLVILKSISKSYGVPGLRLGVLVSSKSDLIQEVLKNNSIWNINSFAEYFLQIYDKYKSSYKASCDKLATERIRFAKKLSEIKDIQVFPSQANYIMCKYTGTKTVTEITENLLQEYNLLVKNLTRKYGCGAKYMRLAVLTPKDDDDLIMALKKEIEK